MLGWRSGVKSPKNFISPLRMNDRGQSYETHIKCWCHGLFNSKKFEGMRSNVRGQITKFPALPSLLHYRRLNCYHTTTMVEFVFIYCYLFLYCGRFRSCVWFRKKNIIAVCCLAVCFCTRNCFVLNSDSKKEKKTGLGLSSFRRKFSFILGMVGLVIRTGGRYDHSFIGILTWRK